MNILDQIIAQKQLEVQQSKQRTSFSELEQSPLFYRDVFSLSQFIKDPAKTGIIAEYKRKSPSKGIINDRSDVFEVTSAYAEHGASGLSVLTDGPFFGGNLHDLQAARPNAVPLLRKEFIIDEYQLSEAKAHGADAILLIAACLSPQRVKELAKAARALALEILLEIHDETELGHICPEVNLVGVNNRNLKNFEVDLEHSIRLSEKIGSQLKIAESGIRSAADIRFLKANGFDGFLIGEMFMKQSNPGAVFAGLVQELDQNI
ncbi:MAG: indole-3-glycerol phosphate synthase TrpC [Sphingobacteriaceae bacterium]